MMYPAQQTAEQLAKHGRYGDSVLVHMNPAEVQGIAALSPTGKLTRNPVTGQPEAFLPMLIPLLASWGGSTLLGGTIAAGLGVSAATGAAIAGGLGSGLATAAITGDLKRGLVSGIVGAGVGSALGAAGANVDAGGVMSETGGIDPSLAKDMMAATNPYTGATTGALTQPGAIQASFGSDALSAAASNPNIASGLEGTAAMGVGGGNAAMGASKPGIWDQLSKPFQKNSGLMGEVTKARTTMPLALGMGQMAEWDQQDLLEEGSARRRREDEEKRRRSEFNLQYGYSAAQPYGFEEGGSTNDALSNLTPEQRDAINRYLGNTGGADPVTIQSNLRGKYKKAPPSDYMHGFNAEFDWFQNDPDVTVVPDYKKGAFGWSEPYYQNYASPINRFQYGTPDWWWPERPGNRPYFDSMIGNDIGWEPPGSEPNQNRVPPPPNQPPDNPDQPPDNNTIDQLRDILDIVIGVRDAGGTQPPVGPPGGGGSGGGGGGGGEKNPPQRLHSINADYANMPIMELFRQAGVTQMMAAGGTAMPTPLGEAPVAAGGVADVGRQIGMQQMQKPAPDEVQMVVAAISGEMGEQGSRVIELFIQKYGVNMFRAIRQKVLQMIQPGAQTEGMVQGAGGGMDDQVMGMIGNQQPVAVSPGEYIVPADVVSGLGDGSSDAGAAELDQMAQRVRRARGGSIEQPPPLNARQFTPL